MNSILVTGGAGFIGSNFVELALQQGYRTLVLDAFTYAGHKENLENLPHQNRLEIIEGNICDETLVKKILSQNQIQMLFNFAAESHVDRSITGPGEFIQTNIMGTFNLLSCARQYWDTLGSSERQSFRYVQISTDEVYGELGDEGKFSETTPYAPNSPYSASKAAGDHLVRAWFHTYGMPTITTNCSNNYGPKQYPEKLIPHMVLCALNEKPLPVYGNGKNVRDWIHVADHCRGVMLAAQKGTPGETYCFGGNSERTNLAVVNALCKIMDAQKPRANGQPYSELITFVEDRKGHDWRYAIDDTKALTTLGFERTYKEFEDGLKATIAWMLENTEWINNVTRKNK